MTGYEVGENAPSLNVFSRSLLSFQIGLDIARVVV